MRFLQPVYYRVVAVHNVDRSKEPVWFLTYPLTEPFVYTTRKKPSRENFKLAAVIPDEAGLMKAIVESAMHNFNPEAKDPALQTQVFWAEGLTEDGLFYMCLGGEMASGMVQNFKTRIQQLVDTKSGIALLQLGTGNSIQAIGFGTGDILNGAFAGTDLLEISIVSGLKTGPIISPGDRWFIAKTILEGRFPDYDGPFAGISANQTWLAKFSSVERFSERETIEAPISFDPSSNTTHFVAAKPKSSSLDLSSRTKISINLVAEDRTELVADLSLVVSSKNLHVHSFQAGLVGTHVQPFFGVEMQVLAPPMKSPQLDAFCGILKRALDDLGVDARVTKDWNVQESGFRRV